MHTTRVLPAGSGMFSNPKIQYSKDTQDFVKVLMNEAHLTNLQRNGFQSILRSGDSLPLNAHNMMRERFLAKRKALGKALGLPTTINGPSQKPRRSSFPLGSGRRSYEAIKQSGAYDPTPARPFVAPVSNKEKEIARLQHQMAYGTNKPSEVTLLKDRPKEKSIEEEKIGRFAEIVDEISDRIEFLSSMQQIGRDKVYRSMIEYQIREKLTELEQNYPGDVQAVVEHFGLQKFMTKIELP